MSSILDLIQLNYQKLSKTEKKIADFVMDNKETLLNIHIQDLADQINVSVAAITRFCKKIGSKSFVEFKILLRDAAEQTAETDDAISKVNHFYQSVIKSSNSLTDLEKFKIAINWMLKSKTIHIYGIGSSGLSAQEFKLRLVRMGMVVDTHTDSHSMIINASTLSQHDLVIAISSSGQTKEVIEGVQLAKRNGAKVITITNFAETLLTTSSDLVLYTASINTHLNKGFMNSQLSIMINLDILSMMLLLNTDALKVHKQTLAALNEYKKI